MIILEQKSIPELIQVKNKFFLYILIVLKKSNFIEIINIFLKNYKITYFQEMKKIDKNTDIRQTLFL